MFNNDQNEKRRLNAIRKKPAVEWNLFLQNEGVG